MLAAPSEAAADRRFQRGVGKVFKNRRPAVLGQVSAAIEVYLADWVFVNVLRGGH